LLQLVGLLTGQGPIQARAGYEYIL